MTQSANCKKIMSLLALYIDNKLDDETMEFVENHLQICPECNKKYHMLKDLIFELRRAYQQFDTDIQTPNRAQFNIKEHEKFQTNLSAYFDNELPLNESLIMKKYMIKYPKARKELEELYLLHSIINTSFNGIKKNFNDNYAKKICFKIQGKNFDEKKHLRFKIASYVASFLIILILIFYSSPIGKTVIDKSIEFFKRNTYVSAPTNIYVGEVK